MKFTPRRPWLVATLASALLMAGGIANPAQASSKATIHFGVGAGGRAYSSYPALPDPLSPTVPAAAAATLCSLVVPSHSDGHAVLDAALAQGCIHSYNQGVGAQLVWGNWNDSVTCIDDVCWQYAWPGTVGSRWYAYRDGKLSDAYLSGGLRALKVHDGETLVFGYAAYNCFCD